MAGEGCVTLYGLASRILAFHSWITGNTVILHHGGQCRHNWKKHLTVTAHIQPHDCSWRSPCFTGLWPFDWWRGCLYRPGPGCSLSRGTRPSSVSSDHRRGRDQLETVKQDRLGMRGTLIIHPPLSESLGYSDTEG